MIDSDKLPRSPGQQAAIERRREQTRGVVEEALGLQEPATRRRYSVRDLKAFQIGLPLFQGVAERFGAEHPATQALRRVLEMLARGCHRYRGNEKAEAYHAARDAASQAALELAILGPEAGALLDGVEQELMAGLVGLLRRAEGRDRP